MVAYSWEILKSGILLKMKWKGKGKKVLYLYNILLLLLLFVPQNTLEMTQTWGERYFRCLHISEKKCSSHLELIPQINTLIILAAPAANFLGICLENWALVLFHNAMYIEQRPKRWSNARPPVIVKGRDGVYKCVGRFVCKAWGICSHV